MEELDMEELPVPASEEWPQRYEIEETEPKQREGFSPNDFRQRKKKLIAEDARSRGFKELPLGRRVLRAIGRPFGVVDKRYLLIWREALNHRAQDHDLGVCFRNACGCLDGLHSKFRKRHVATEDDYKEGANAFLVYDSFIKVEEEIPDDAVGVNHPHHRPQMIVDMGEKTFNKYFGRVENKDEDEQRVILHEIAKKLKPLPVNFPWFLVLISIIQIIACIVLCCLGGIEKMGLDPFEELIPDVVTFRGIETVDIWVRPNVWIGPPVSSLILAGAVYGPCMRTDATLAKFLENCDYDRTQPFGCCAVQKHELAATTYKDECKDATLGGGTWSTPNCSTSNVNVKHILKPCCYGLLGSCKMTTETGCKAQRGFFHACGPEHCSEVFCFPHICNSLGLKQSEKKKFMPSAVSQGWRFLVSIIYPPGILHLIFTLIIQWALGRPIEEMIGFWRMAVVYLYASFGGNLVGCFMEPYLAHVGSGGATFCFLSIAFAEVIQARKEMEKFIWELLLLILIGVIILVVGFIPLVSNWVHLGGVIFGLPLAYVVMPHLNFNYWTRRARRWIVGICLVIIILVLILFLLLFFYIQDTGACSGCYLFSCIPFTEHMCNVLVELIGSVSAD